MNNPTIEKNYTTVFKDGSIIYENPWVIRATGEGKWYWNESYRGGVIAWFEIPENGYNFHKEYQIPDWEFEDILNDAYRYRALAYGGVDNWEWYAPSIHDFCEDENASCIYDIVMRDMKNGYYAKYLIKK